MSRHHLPAPFLWEQSLFSEKLLLRTSSTTHRALTSRCLLFYPFWPWRREPFAMLVCPAPSLRPPCS